VSNADDCIIYQLISEAKTMQIEKEKKYFGILLVGFVAL
jgi:hypothetical protein